MKLITEIKLKPEYSEEDLISAICSRAKINKKNLRSYEIIKQGIDARKKPNVYYVMNVAIDVDECAYKQLLNFQDIVPDHSGLIYEQVCSNKKRPVVVGFGPSGMFCALVLSYAGLNPIVIEQGKRVEERQIDVENFWRGGELNVYSNVQYGEGGAGTFSDGKLNTTLNNSYCKKVINEFIKHGAPKEIYYKNKPHIGTDGLKQIVKNVRAEIIKNGGNVIFNANFCDFSIKNGNISSIFYKNTLNGEICKLECDELILAIGHSSINTFELLKSKNIYMRQKPFAMGVRIEHEQELINVAQYGNGYNKQLPSADYKLVEHLKNGRSVFSFCMCPGGSVVASSCEHGGVITNGMSNYKRDGKYANSAVLVNVLPSDFGGDDVLQGLYFQRKYEKLAYELAGKNYFAPAQMVGSFLNGGNKKVEISTYLPGVKWCDIGKCLPEFVTSSIREALPLFNKKIKGFTANNAVLIAPETRSSCPVQFNRTEDYICTIGGLYACGEGAGYSGGIISSAVDGIKCAEKIIKKYI